MLGRKIRHCGGTIDHAVVFCFPGVLRLARDMREAFRLYRADGTWDDCPLSVAQPHKGQCLVDFFRHIQQYLTLCQTDCLFGEPFDPIVGHAVTRKTTCTGCLQELRPAGGPVRTGGGLGAASREGE